MRVSIVNNFFNKHHVINNYNKDTVEINQIRLG